MKRRSFLRALLAIPAAAAAACEFGQSDPQGPTGPTEPDSTEFYGRPLMEELEGAQRYTTHVRMRISSELARLHTSSRSELQRQLQYRTHMKLLELQRQIGDQFFG